MDTKLIVAKIRDAEAQLDGAEKRTAEVLLGLARHYQDLFNVTRSAKAAARIAQDAKLRYHHDTDITRLIRWAELFDSVRMEIGGGADSVCPPFTPTQVRPILATKYWEPLGPGGMADLWPGIEDGPDKIKRFVAAVKADYAKRFAPTTTPNLKKKPKKIDSSREAIRDAAVAFIKLNGWDAFTKLTNELADDHMPHRQIARMGLTNAGTKSTRTSKEN